MAQELSWKDSFVRDYYLKNRLSLAFYSNCTFAFADEAGCPDACSRAAKLIAAVRRQRPPVITSRIPKLGRDDLRQSKGDWIVVACLGQFYLLKQGATENTLRALVHDARCSAPEPEVGWLTLLPRDAFAEVYPLLGKNVELIQNAVILVALDLDAAPKNDNEFAHALANGGLGNRWFDLSLQLIVTGNGRAGGNTEHTVYDSLPAGTYVNSLMSDVPAASEDQGYEKIRWPNDLKISQAIAEAKNFAEAEVSKREIHCVRTRAFERDVDVQMAIQLAAKEIFGAPQVTSEALSMAHMPEGRYATIFFESPEDLQNHRQRIKSAKLGEPIQVLPCEIVTSNAGHHEHIPLIGFTDTDPNIVGISYIMKPTETVFHIKADGVHKEKARKYAYFLNQLLR